jgi:hypothetical protein
VKHLNDRFSEAIDRPLQTETDASWFRHRFLWRLERFTQNEQGVFTIEASMVFPILLLANVAFIVFALYVYQLVTLQIHADAAAERIVTHWHESPAAGRLPLYWRTSDNGGTTVQIPATGHKSYTGGSIQEQKLARGIRGIPEGMSGTAEFQNKVIRQFVVVKLEHPIKLSPFITFFLPDKKDNGKIQAEAVAEAMDSTEFARYIDFAFSYALKKEKNSLSATQDAFSKIFGFIKSLIK